MNSTKNTLQRKAFTMVELMAILIILGLLATVVVRKVGTAIEKARVTTTKTSLKLLHGAVTSFYLDTGNTPDSLSHLVTEPGSVSGWNGAFVMKDWNETLERRWNGRRARKADPSRTGDLSCDASLSRSRSSP